MANEKNSEIYRNSGSYAREHGEIEKWRESKAMNIACRDAIDKAVAENYDGAHLKTDKILDAVVSDFRARACRACPCRDDSGENS